MDKAEYNLKLEEIYRCVDQGNYAEAARIADTIDWKRVRNVRTLCMISEIYEAEDRYAESKELLLRAYRRSPVGRTILQRLVEVTIHLKQFDEAMYGNSGTDGSDESESDGKKKKKRLRK